MNVGKTEVIKGPATFAIYTFFTCNNVYYIHQYYINKYINKYNSKWFYFQKFPEVHFSLKCWLSNFLGHYTAISTTSTSINKCIQFLPILFCLYIFFYYGFSTNLKIILTCNHYLVTMGCNCFSPHQITLPPAIIAPPVIIISAHWPSGQTTDNHASWKKGQ